MTLEFDAYYAAYMSLDDAYNTVVHASHRSTYEILATAALRQLNDIESEGHRKLLLLGFTAMHESIRNKAQAYDNQRLGGTNTVRNYHELRKVLDQYYLGELLEVVTTKPIPQDDQYILLKDGVVDGKLWHGRWSPEVGKTLDKLKPVSVRNLRSGTSLFCPQ